MDFSPKIRLRNKTVNRALRFHTLLYKLVSIVDTRNLRLVIENPYTSTYLKYNFLRPQVIDMNRMKRGGLLQEAPPSTGSSTASLRSDSRRSKTRRF